jgi:hypothetical protein
MIKGADRDPHASHWPFINGIGQEPPRRSLAVAAAVTSKADTKADGPRGSSGPISDIHRDIRSYRDFAMSVTGTARQCSATLLCASFMLISRLA